MKEEKVLKLQIDRKCFVAIAKGEQTVEHRYIYPSNQVMYVYFLGADGKSYKKQDEIPQDVEVDEIKPREYSHLVLINGRRKDAPRLKVEIKNAEFVVFTDEDGNDITFEENGVEYLACQVWYHLGKVVEIENADTIL